MTYEDFIESMYDLDREDMRRFAYELLLASDGPAKIDGQVTGRYTVINHGANETSFTIRKSLATLQQGGSHPSI